MGPDLAAVNRRLRAYGHFTPLSLRATSMQVTNKEVRDMTIRERQALLNSSTSIPLEITASTTEGTHESSTVIIRSALPRRMVQAFAKTARHLSSERVLGNHWHIDDVPVYIVEMLFHWMEASCRSSMVPSFNLEELEPEDVVRISIAINSLGIDPFLPKIHEQLCNYILTSYEPIRVIKLWRITVDLNCKRVADALKQDFPTYLTLSHTKDLAKAWTAATELGVLPAITMLRKHMLQYVRHETITAEALKIIHKAAPGEAFTADAIVRYAAHLNKIYKRHAMSAAKAELGAVDENLWSQVQKRIARRMVSKLESQHNEAQTNVP